MSFHRNLFAALVVATCWAQSSPAADATDRFLEHAPVNTCLAVYSHDLAATCAAFTKTELGGKLAGQPFEPLIASLYQRGKASALRLRPLFGFDWSDLAATRDSGGMLVFPLDDGAQGVVWLFSPAEVQRDTPRCLTAAAEYFNSHGFQGSTSTRGGANFSAFAPPRDRESEPTRVLFATSKLYGVANSQAAADAVLAVTADKSLAAQSNVVSFADADTNVEESDLSSVRFLLRPFQLWELVRAQNKDAAAAESDESDDDSEEDEVAAAKRIGLSAVQWVAGKLRFADESCEWAVDATMQIERPYRGAMRIFEFQPGPLSKLPDWIASDVTTAGVWRWDFPLAMKGFGTLYDQANEPGPYGEGLFEDMLDGLRDDPEGVQVDLRRDIFQQLAPELTRISDAGPAADGDSSDEANQETPGRWLYVADVPDVPRVVDALSRFYKGDERVKRQSWSGFDVWTVEGNASLFVEGESDSLVTVRGLAVGDGKLIFSTDAALLRDAVEQTTRGAKLADDQGWQRLLEWSQAHTDETTAFQSLLRPDRLLEPSYTAATSGPPPMPEEATSEDDEAPQVQAEPLAARLLRVLLFGDTSEGKEVPYSAAPQFEVLRDALEKGAIVMSQTEGGWMIRFGVINSGEQEF